VIDKPADEWTEADWERLYRRSYEQSSKVLDALEDQGTGGTFSPQVAGYALIIAAGRISGRHGFRGIPFEQAWELWTDDGAKRQFRLAFESERKTEN